MNRSNAAFRLGGLALLFGVTTWGVFIQLSVLEDGYLDAGDDHIHIAYANELARIWREEGRALGWSTLYGTGAPIFLLRPPGLYAATVACHFLTGLTIEQSLKMVVVLGLSLFPLSVFVGARLLGLAFWAALCAGLFAPLPIGLWGHTLGSYYFLGVHKQLLAILLFPLVVGWLWRLLREGRHGLLFALLFPALLFTHPYIAYCLVLLAPAMLVTLVTREEGWHWQRGLTSAVLWSVPALLLSLGWLLPFFSSPEIQAVAPFSGLRQSFDVIVRTTAETLRQLFLGGLLDTTVWAGPFGDHEWGWLDNSHQQRLPILTVLALIGACTVIFRPQRAVDTFLGLAFLTGALLFIGPDDFPFLDLIPFAGQFQNIHAIFLFEWAAIVLGGIACHRICVSGARWGAQLHGPYLGRCVGVLALAAIAGCWLLAMAERTAAAHSLIGVRNVHTANGEFVPRRDIRRDWAHFGRVVDRLRRSDTRGGVTARPKDPEATVLFNMLPLMANRPLFVSGFEQVGGTYKLLKSRFRSRLLDNLRLQRLFNVRFVISRSDAETPPREWPDSMKKIHADPYWELREVQGEFAELEPLPSDLMAYLGPEREWAAFMNSWLEAYLRSDPSLPWIVNLTHAGADAASLRELRPLLRKLIVAGDARIPAELEGVPRVAYGDLGRDPAVALRKFADEELNPTGSERDDFQQELLRADRTAETFLLRNPGAMRPVLFKRAFYRGWEAEIDGNRSALYRVSPGLQMFLAEKGEHTVSFSYTGPNNWSAAKLSVAAGFLFAGVLFWRFRAAPRARSLSERRTDSGSPRGWRKALRLVPGAVWVFFTLVFAVQVYSEAWLGIPVQSRPPAANRDAKALRVVFGWSRVVGIPVEQQKFRVEVASDRAFEQLVREKTVSTHRVAFTTSKLEPGLYYYRVRLETSDREYHWSRPTRFTIEP